MTPRDLIAAFEKVAEAPDGVKRLRELVLQLAVRGKLVPQDPEDQPASVLLERIAEEKARLVKTNDLRTQKALPPVKAAECPYQVPHNWAWCRFGSSHINRDAVRVPLKSADRKRRQGPYDYYGASGVIDKIDDYLFEGDLLLIGEDGANLVNRSTPIAFMATGKFWVNNHAHVLDSIDTRSLKYLAIFVNSIDLKPFLTGTAQPKLNQAKMNRILTALPPLKEQQRIVALSEAETAEDMELAWTRFAERIDDLVRHPDDIKPIRQAVLELAVRGKLVPQDPEDEPASVLLAERALPNHDRSPAGWSCASIRSLGDIKGGGTPSKREHTFWDGNVPWVCPKDMKRDFIGESILSVTRLAVEASSVKLIRSPSLLMVVRGMILAHSFPVALTTATVTVNQDMKALIPFDPRIAPWLLLASKGLKRIVLALVQRSTHGTCKLKSDDLFSMVLPIPPLAEQHRIVVRVDEIMSLLDRLEQQLTAAQSTHAAFAAAAVHHLDS